MFGRFRYRYDGLSKNIDVSSSCSMSSTKRFTIICIVVWWISNALYNLENNSSTFFVTYDTETSVIFPRTLQYLKRSVSSQRPSICSNNRCLKFSQIDYERYSNRLSVFNRHARTRARIHPFPHDPVPNATSPPVLCLLTTHYFRLVYISSIAFPQPRYRLLQTITAHVSPTPEAFAWRCRNKITFLCFSVFGAGPTKSAPLTRCMKIESGAGGTILCSHKFLNGFHWNFCTWKQNKKVKTIGVFVGRKSKYNTVLLLHSCENKNNTFLLSKYYTFSIVSRSNK